MPIVFGTRPPSATPPAKVDEANLNLSDIYDSVTAPLYYYYGLSKATTTPCSIFGRAMQPTWRCSWRPRQPGSIGTDWIVDLAASHSTLRISYC